MRATLAPGAGEHRRLRAAGEAGTQRLPWHLQKEPALPAHTVR